MGAREPGAVDANTGSRGNAAGEKIPNAKPANPKKLPNPKAGGPAAPDRRARAMTRKRMGAGAGRGLASPAGNSLSE
jgi:hypothetical protein